MHAPVPRAAPSHACTASSSTLCGANSAWSGEVDGLDGHRTRAQRQRDYQRDLVLRRNGFVVLRYSYQQVKRQAPEVVDDLIRALALDYQR